MRVVLAVVGVLFVCSACNPVSYAGSIGNSVAAKKAPQDQSYGHSGDEAYDTYTY